MSATAAVAPVPAATEVKKKRSKDRVGKAKRANLCILPRRCATQIKRRIVSRKQIADEGLIEATAFIEVILKRLLAGAVESAKHDKPPRQRLKSLDIQNSLDANPELKSLFRGIVPHARRHRLNLQF